MAVDDTIKELEEMFAKVIDSDGPYLCFIEWLWTRDSGEEVQFEVGVRTHSPAYTLNTQVSSEKFTEMYGDRSYQVTPEGILLPKELAQLSSEETVPFEAPDKIYISIPTAFDREPYLGD